MLINTIGKVFNGYYLFNNRGKMFQCDSGLIKELTSLYALQGSSKFNEFLLKNSLINSFDEPFKVQFRNCAYNFGRASYEIIDKCNYNCKHCYLGKDQKAVSLKKKFQILDKMEESGIIFLQITGGEPTLDLKFSEVYEYAYNKGFLITLMTNGYFLNNHIQELVRLPPYKISLSLYGGTAETYDSFVGKKGAFYQLMNNLQLCRINNVSLETKIIVTKYNQHEIDDMIEIASKHGEYFVYNHLNPKLTGERVDDLLCDKESPENVRRNQKECLAGKTFYHVNCQGHASICKMSRDPFIDFLNDDIGKLEGFYNGLQASCKTGKYNSCRICLPQCLTYKKSGIVLCNDSRERGETC